MRVRNLLQKDAELMLEWMHDDDVVHYLKADFTSKTITDCRNFIIASEDKTHDIHLAVTDDHDEYMGTVSLKHVRNESAEFGITIRKNAMGKGYAFFGMKELFRIGFEEYGIKHIYWCVGPDNVRAVRFYDKHGFLRSGVPDQTIGYSAEELSKFIWYSADIKDFGGSYSE